AGIVETTSGFAPAANVEPPPKAMNTAIKSSVIHRVCNLSRIGDDLWRRLAAATRLASPSITRAVVPPSLFLSASDIPPLSLKNFYVPRSLHPLAKVRRAVEEFNLIAWLCMLRAGCKCLNPLISACSSRADFQQLPSFGIFQARPKGGGTDSESV